ncbi:unnamed protein product [Phaedon cochleariae]|uniref:Uncharacterized protein n=1 Tax=Phaedon cochleariae TaxID=80249 RepID=A0A9P0DPM8_PHACE|nr:unnamed protein product [Phaedon cochleariae]
MNVNSTLSIFFCLIFVIESRDLPKYFPNCHRYDPKINECLVKATEQVKPFLAKGVPELSMPPLEPFIIPEVVLEQGTSALNFKATLTNVTIHGITNYKFSRFEFDVPNMQFFCDADLGEMIIKGNYTVNGKILIAPIVGSGTFVASIDNCNATVYQKVEVRKKKGVDYIFPVHTNSSIYVGGPKVNLNGLFDGNPELNNVTNKVISDNIDELFEDIRPVIDKVLTNILEDFLLKAVEGQVPFDKLYPPIP